MRVLIIVTRILRNLLVGVGAYCVSRWVGIVLSALLMSIARWLGGDDYVARSLLRSFATSVPDAFGAALAGIAVVWLAESPRPAAWAFVPAALLFLGSLDEALTVAASWTAYLSQTTIATLPALACLAAGFTAARHRAQ